MPVYNAETTVEKCVESLVFGEQQDIEVILVEDCSKDNSWAVCQRLSAKYENVHSYQNDKNSGVSYTRNHGLSKAHGEYILFVDSDDWVSGKYAITLLEMAKKYPDALVICGLHFHDDIMGQKTDYLWEKNGEAIYVVEQEQFFELPKKFHLQQLWNKIFHRSIIEQFKIRFDETQSMGEDFQFVLDYMEAAKCQQCVVINEPLYYYIRANNSSLMSKFGLIENGNEYRRLEKLLHISGANNPKVNQQYLEAVQNTKLSYVYSVARVKNKTKREKIAMIENIMQDGQACKYYQKQRNVYAKEKLFVAYKYIKRIPQRIKGRVQRQKSNKKIASMRSRVTDKPVSIISQNCIGGVIYHDMGKRFLSPTINLFLTCPDFVKFVLNLEYYMSLKLQMNWEEEYPVGKLEDIKIYFMHYQTCTEAKEAWDRRKARIDWDNILVLSTDMEEFTDNVFESWQKIQYPKVLFSAKRWDDASCAFYPKYAKQGQVQDLIPGREFYNQTFFERVNS